MFDWKMFRKAIIFGIKGKKLTSFEKSFFKKNKPWGLIIFSRNVESLKQLKKLIDEIKSIMKDKNYPILIDQEGGRVSRLNRIMDFQIFSQDFFAKLYKRNNKNFIHTYKVYINTVSNIFKSVGININTAPVLDVKVNNGNNIIGNRAFSNDPNLVAKLGNICVDFLAKDGDEALYPRSIEVIESGGVLIQAKNIHSEFFFFDLCNDIIFNSEDELIELLRNSLNSQKLKQLYKKFYEKFGNDNLNKKTLDIIFK